MGIIKNFFNKINVASRVELITEKGNGFYSWNGKLYQSDIIRACINPKVKAIGKLVPKHIRNNTKEGFSINPEPYIKFLLEDPNPYMSGQMLQEKAISQLEINNNSFIYIMRDEFGYPIELYPICGASCEAIYDKEGYLFLKFYLENGKSIIFPYSDIIHLRQNYNDNELFGTSNIETLKPLMEIVTTADQGIVKAIKNGAVIKWLLKFHQTLRPEDIQKQTKEFTDTFLNISNTGGAAAVDAKADAQQVSPNDYVPNSSQSKESYQRIYSLFGTNDKIVQSKYNEDEWNAYYESVIEPIALQMSNEYTRKLFSRRERGFGNKIIFESANLQYASMSTKLNLQSMVDRGALTPNEWRQIFNLGPVEDGDKPIRRLDTQVVKGGETK